MDLHTVIKNLHTGKRSISDKNFSTILNIDEISSSDCKIAGNYYSNLALLKELEFENIKKKGFVLTHQGILMLLQENSLLKNITNVLRKVTSNNVSSSSDELKQILESITFSELLQVQLLKAYHSLQEKYPNSLLRVKISHSHTNQEHTDLFQEDFSYVATEDDLFKAIINSLLFFYNEDNLYSRLQEKVNENEISLAIGFEVVELVSVSGLCSSLDLKSGHTSLIQIHSSFGDEVYNRVHLSSTDSFQIFKEGLNTGHQAILPPQISTKKHILSYHQDEEDPSNVELRVKDLSDKEKDQPSLSYGQVKMLSKLLLKLEKSLEKKIKSYTPIKFSFSIINNTSDTSKLSILIEDISFEKKHAHMTKKEIASYELLSPQTKPIATGIAIGNCITHGFIKFIKNQKDLTSISKEDIIVAHSTFPHWEPYIKNAKALIIEQGSETSHSAQICYEYNIPALINVGSLEHKIKDKSVATIDCSSENGALYSNLEKYSIKTLGNNSDLNIKNEDLTFKKTIKTKLAQITNKHNILEKAHLPYDSQIVENIFDLVPSSVYEHKLHSPHSTYSQALKDSIIQELSKIAISRFPQDVWVNLASFSPTYYEIIDKKETTYFKCSKAKGILKTLEPSFENHIKYILSIISYLRDSIGCNNIYIYVENVQQKTEIKQLKDILNKYKYRSKLGGILEIGGILNIEEIIEEFDLIGCNLNTIRNCCSSNNRSAIIKMARYCIIRSEEILKNQKNSNKEVAIFNVTINDVDILQSLKNHCVDLISCKYNEIIPLHSFLVDMEMNKSVKDSKFVKRIEFK